MYRVRKAAGWNQYKVQKRFMWLFWRDVKGAVFDSEGKASIAWSNLTLINNKG